MIDQSIQELADHLRSYWCDTLQLGLVTFDELSEWAWEDLDEDVTASEEQVQEAVRLVWDERVAEQAGWPTSDADRLQAAFDELEAGGVVARMGLECCGTCANYVLWNQIKPARPELTGYTYFTTQTAQEIPETGVALLAHGAFVPRGADGEDEADDANAVRVLAALQAQALHAQREGRYGIRVEVPDWRRRLPARGGAAL